MEAILTAGFAVMGLAVGSFLNVCIDRLPQGGSVLSPPSHCPACQHRLSVRDLVPVFSYLWLRGRCRYCRAPIPRRLLGVELTTAAIFALLYRHTGLVPQLGVMAFYASIFIIVFVIDLEHGLILNRVLYVGMAAALLFALLVPQPYLIQWKAGGAANAAIGGAIGFVVFLIIALAARGGMGWGDVKLAALVGLAAGFPLVFVAIVMAALLGGVVAVVLLATKKRGRKQAIPFGPFLSVAALITLLWGSSILYWYLGLM